MPRADRVGVNKVGEVEISRIVLEELLANALIHRDYFVSAPVRILFSTTGSKSSVPAIYRTI